MTDTDSSMGLHLWRKDLMALMGSTDPMELTGHMASMIWAAEVIGYWVIEVIDMGVWGLEMV